MWIILICLVKPSTLFDINMSRFLLGCCLNTSVSHSDTVQIHCLSAWKPQMGVWSSHCLLHWLLAKPQRKHWEEKRKWDTCAPSYNVRIWPRQMCCQDEGFNTPVIGQICFQSRANLQSAYCSDAIIQAVFWIHMALSPLQSARGISILIGFLMGYLWAHPQWKFLSFKLTRLGFSHP